MRKDEHRVGHTDSEIDEMIRDAMLPIRTRFWLIVIALVLGTVIGVYGYTTTTHSVNARLCKQQSLLKTSVRNESKGNLLAWRSLFEQAYANQKGPVTKKQREFEVTFLNNLRNGPYKRALSLKPTNCNF